MKTKPVIVEWEDASSNSGFYDSKDPATYDTVYCQSIGYIIRKDKRQLVLASEKFTNGDLRHIHSIPRKMIKKITPLKEV